MYEPYPQFLLKQNVVAQESTDGEYQFKYNLHFLNHPDS